MLNLKKVIALVCVFALALTTVAFGATYSDVAEDSAYYEAVETLNKLGIVNGYEDGTFKPEDGVTRAEMAKLIAYIQGYGETAKGSANTGFTDVPSTHWASGYIANAAGMGIINGYGDGTFGPEDQVLYEQAVKMVMATLGYTPFAEKNGGYPTGYLAAAQRYDVSLAVANAVQGTPANRGTVAQLLVNALDTPLMVQAQWNTNGEVTYIIADGSTNVAGNPVSYKTLMSENLGYVKIRGIVEENTVSSIMGAKNIDTTKEAAVKIDVVDDYKSTNSTWKKDKPVTTFLVGDTDAEAYLGQSVIAYVEKVGNDWEIVSIAVDTARNEELVISLDQFNDGGSASAELKYFKEGSNDVTKVKIYDNSDSDENDFAVVVNGEFDGNANIKTAVNGKLNYGGQIRLIDNNDINGYDVAFIDIAYTAVVDEVTKNKIVTKAGVLGDIKYDFEDETKVLTVIKDGAEIDVAELVEYDVLSIYANSKNSKYIVIEVLGSNVVGTITSSKSSKTSQGGTAYQVDGTWYDVAAGAYKASDLAVGEGGTIYVDQFGKIAAFIEDSALAGGAAKNYAYVIAVAGEKSGFGNVDVQLQMLTADGVVVKSLANNAKLELATAINHDEDGGTTPVTKEFKVDLDAWDPSDSGDAKKMDGTDAGITVYNAIAAMASDVVQYTVNSAGYITRITEAGFDADFATAGSFAADAEFDSARAKFGSQKVEKDAIVFVTGTPSDITKYSVATLDAFVNEELYSVTVGYQDKRSDAPNVIVIPVGELSTSASASVAVVTEAGNGTDAAGNEIYTITYFIDGEEVTSDTTADIASTVAIPTPGDILKINITDEAISTLEYVFDFSEVIRDNYRDIANTSDVTLATTTNAVATKGNYVRTGLEVIYGGIVTDCNDDYQISFANDLWTSSAVNNKYLDEAKNVYVIEVGGRNTVIDTGSYRDFSFFEDLYTDGASKLYSVDGSTTYDVAGDAKAAYGDHVYVREYDGDIIDVVIVKGLVDDVEASANGVTVTFNKNGADGTQEMAAQTVIKSRATALKDNVYTNTGNVFNGWNTAADGSGVNYADGADITITVNTTLYAQWTPAP